MKYKIIVPLFAAITILLSITMLPIPAFANDLDDWVPEITACEPTPTITASDITQTKVTLKWTGSNYCLEDGEILYSLHSILRYEDGRTLNTKDLAVHRLNLEPNTEYTMSVVAIYSGANNQAAYVTFTTLKEYDYDTGCLDCTPPTFGKIVATGQQWVDYGFEFGDTHHVVDEFHVETPLISAEVGVPYEIKMKVYENFRDLHQAGMAFGVPTTINPSYDTGMAFIEWDEIYTKNYFSSKKYTLAEKDNDDLFRIISNSAGKEVCNPNTTQLCQTFTANVIFNQKIENQPIVIRAVDVGKNVGTNFINDGLQVSGVSLNAPPTFMVSDKFEQDIHKTITITDRTLEDQTKATDESGIQWNLVDGFWQRDAPLQVIQDTDPNSRNSEFFKEKIAYEQAKAYYTIVQSGY